MRLTLEQLEELIADDAIDGLIEYAEPAADSPTPCFYTGALWQDYVLEKYAAQSQHETLCAYQTYLLRRGGVRENLVQRFIDDFQE